METQHKCKLEYLCRVCGNRLQKESLAVSKKAKGYAPKQNCYFECKAFSEDLMGAFHIDTILRSTQPCSATGII